MITVRKLAAGAVVLAAVGIIWWLAFGRSRPYVATPPDPPTVIDPAFISTSQVTLGGVDLSGRMHEFDQEVELAAEGSFRLAEANVVVESLYAAFYADYEGARRLKRSTASLEFEPQTDGSIRFSGEIETPDRAGVYEFVVYYPSRKAGSPPIYVAHVRIREKEQRDVRE